MVGRGDSFDVAVATGVRPQMAAEAVAHVAEAELKKMTARRHADLSQYDIVKLNGVRYADVGAITGTAYTPDPSEADDVTWVVRVKGPLISWISLPGVTSPTAGICLSTTSLLKLLAWISTDKTTELRRRRQGRVALAAHGSATSDPTGAIAAVHERAHGPGILKTIYPLSAVLRNPRD
jgi:hypothetical protein